jgi:hypothetical protein
MALKFTEIFTDLYELEKECKITLDKIKDKKSQFNEIKNELENIEKSIKDMERNNIDLVIFFKIYYISYEFS